MLKRIFTCTFLCFSFVFYPQQKQIDSLTHIINTYKKKDSTRLIALNDLAFYYYSINPKKGVEVAQQALALAKEIHDKKREVIALSYMGHNYSANSQDSLALAMYDKAIAENEKLNNKVGIAKLTYNKGLVYFNQAQYERANDCNKQAYEVFSQVKDSFFMAKMLNSMGINEMYLSHYTISLSHYLSAKKMYEDLKLTNDLQYASITSNIGLLYARLNKTTLSLEYQQKALDLFKAKDFQQGIANALTNIGRLQTDLGKPEKALEFYEEALAIMKKNDNERGVASALTNIGIAYTEMEQYKAAIPYFDNTRVIYEKLKNDTNLAIVHQNLGDCYFKGDFNSGLLQAEQHYNKARVLAEDSGNLDLLYDVLESLAAVSRKKGDYRRAFNFKEQAIVVKDSFNTVEKKEEIARLEAKYEYENEKSRIQADFDKKQAATEAEVEKQKLKSTVAIVGGLLLLIAVIGGYFLYKRKRDAQEASRVAAFNSKVAETKLVALRSQMNPHFIFNALNSISDFMAKHHVDKAQEYLIKFAKLTRAILENSSKKWISLEEDLELMALYIEIEALRLGSKLHYTMLVSEDIDKENTLIPPLILQPFIENSIWHGIAPKEDAGHIMIEVKQKDDKLICTVDDDGVGRKKIDLTSNESNSLGVKITKNRLDIINQMHKVKGAFKMIDKDVGLRVELTLPLEHQF